MAGFAAPVVRRLEPHVGRVDQACGAGRPGMSGGSTRHVGRVDGSEAQGLAGVLQGALGSGLDGRVVRVDALIELVGEPHLALP